MSIDKKHHCRTKIRKLRRSRSKVIRFDFILSTVYQSRRQNIKIPPDNEIAKFFKHLKQELLGLEYEEPEKLLP